LEASFNQAITVGFKSSLGITHECSGNLWNQFGHRFQVAGDSLLHGQIGALVVDNPPGDSIRKTSQPESNLPSDLRVDASWQRVKFLAVFIDLINPLASQK